MFFVFFFKFQKEDGEMKGSNFPLFSKIELFSLGRKKGK